MTFFAVEAPLNSYSLAHLSILIVFSCSIRTLVSHFSSAVALLLEITISSDNPSSMPNEPPSSGRPMMSRGRRKQFASGDVIHEPVTSSQISANSLTLERDVDHRFEIYDTCSNKKHVVTSSFSCL